MGLLELYVVEREGGGGCLPPSPGDGLVVAFFAVGEDHLRDDAITEQNQNKGAQELREGFLVDTPDPTPEERGVDFLYNGMLVLTVGLDGDLVVRSILIITLWRRPLTPGRYVFLGLRGWCSYILNMNGPEPGVWASLEGDLAFILRWRHGEDRKHEY